MEIVLASKSPRRRELLSKIVSDFTVIDAKADESVSGSFSNKERICEISRLKCAEAKKQVKDGAVIISADTAVFSGGVQYGKPENKERAIEMLNAFSGKKHSVITAFTVSNGEKTVTKAVETFVYFRKLTKEEIENYVSTDEPYDKAGGYGIQGAAARFIEKIEGDYYNVVGLPVCELTLTLREFGVKEIQYA